MTAAQFFGVLVIGFLLGVAFAAWRQVAYETKLRKYREQWDPPLGSPPSRPLRGSDLAAFAKEEEERMRTSLRKPW